ncbi:MAG: flagellar hook protein FlgE [Mesorhizobium sp.]|jgi:flagellar hook protein FlgE
MSLYGMMRTGVSGMNAQANRLSTTADNIANSGTTGYKRASTEFSSMVIPSSTGNYTSGGVKTNVRYAITNQGDLKYTTSASDLAIDGEGFFVVQNASGSPVLTRAGSFVPDSQGRLVNAAGFYLMGYNFANGDPSAVANGFGGLEAVKISQSELVATPSRNGIFTANLPLDATVVAAANLPSANAATAAYSAKSSLVAYDNLGKEVILDVYFTKTAANTWEVAVYNKDQAGSPNAFPYGGPALTTQTLNFDATTGKLTGATPLSIAIPGGATLSLDISKTTQLGTSYTVLKGEVDGNAPSGIEKVEIGSDGTIYAQYQNGAFKALYRIPIATVQSPDQLAVLPGNVFTQSADSGDVRIGFANEGGMGAVVSGALENSNADIAEELTNMIESQRTYTANSKVFQTGADLMDVLVNLKR